MASDQLPPLGRMERAVLALGEPDFGLLLLLISVCGSQSGPPVHSTAAPSFKFLQPSTTVVARGATQQLLDSSGDRC